MDEGIFEFEDDDGSQTCTDEYCEETESQPWGRHSMRHANREEQYLQKIPADEFLNQLEPFNGPTVKIFITTNRGSKQQTQAFTLSKTLICTRSPFLNHAVNTSKANDPAPQELHVPETSLITFQLLIQFLYTNTVTFPLNIRHPVEKLTHYLHLFTTCHTLHITTLTPLLSRLQNLLKWLSNRGIFPSYPQMRHAMTLPSGHQARSLAVAACVKPYACSITRSSTCYGRALFHLEKLVEESESFAAELLRAYTGAVRGALPAHTIVDPLTMGKWRVTTGVEVDWEK